MKPTLAALTFLAASVAALSPASAQSFSYPDFSDVSQLKLNGSAYQNGNKLTLTRPIESQAGTAWSLTEIDLGAQASFNTVFTFDIQGAGGAGDGADGLTFTLQNNTNSTGSAGGGIGYQGIPNSVTVEFDTYPNFGYPAYDPGSNHVGINHNGNLASDVWMETFPNFDNGATWWVWVDYDGAAKDLAVRWADNATRPTGAMLHTMLDLPAILGDNRVFVGFTSGTGAGWGEHNITSWNFVNRFEEGGAPLPTTTPEPGSLVLMVTGLAGVVGARKKFKNS
jgi:hypothetical protein